MNSPLVSVLVTTYNHEDYISMCLDSILMQKTDFAFELVIAEDCSLDGTKEIVKKYRNRHPDIIRVITSEENVGPVKNGLRGIKACYGKYLSVCDGDDFWNDKYKLQKQVDFLEKNYDYGIVYSDIQIIDKKGERLKKQLTDTKNYYKSGYIFWDLMKICFINTNTVLIRKKILDELLYEEHFDLKTKWFIYDYWFWLNIAREYKIQFLDEKMATYRIHSNNISNDKNFFAERSLHVKLDVISNFGDSFIKSQKERNKTGGTLIAMFIRKGIDLKTRIKIFKMLIKYHPSIKYLFKRFKSKYLVIFLTSFWV